MTRRKTTKKTTKNILKFPKGFLWGASTSAYQIEGGITNDWSQWESSVKRIKKLKKKGKDYREFICGSACDSWHKFEEDLKVIKELNLGAYRMGVEWARIEPMEGQYDMKTIVRYREMLTQLKKEKIKVVLTIWHWTNPVWVSMDHGWADKETVKRYARFTEFLTNELGDLVDFWVTLNEPMVHVLNGYMIAKFPPNKRCFKTAGKVMKNLVNAHKEAYQVIHRKYPKAKVGIAQITNHIEPARKWCLPEVFMAKLAHNMWNHSFLKKIKNHMDYIGFDYYFHDRIVWHPPFKKKKKNVRVNDMGWEIYPEGIYHVLKYLNKFNKPIYVMENGIPDSRDELRRDFIRDHLEHCHRAIKEGVNLKGYFHWSLLDNFEWAAGWEQKFGLVEVDRDNDFKRTIKKSARGYAEICKNNGIKIKEK